MVSFGEQFTYTWRVRGYVSETTPAAVERGRAERGYRNGTPGEWTGDSIYKVQMPASRR